jgi:hypothetical protein
MQASSSQKASTGRGIILGIDRQVFPSPNELREAACFEQSSNRVSKKTTIKDHFGIAKEVAAA